MTKIINITSVSDKIIVIEVLAPGIIISVISVNAPQCSLDDKQKDDFYDSLMNVVIKLAKKKMWL